jgi:hypothetical protein
VEKPGKLDAVLEQYERASAPAIALLYSFEPEQARAALEQSLSELGQPGLSAAEQEALRLKLSYLAYQIDKLASPEENRSAVCSRAYEQLSAPVDSSLAGLMQSIVLIELLAHAERNGWCELPRERMYGLLAGVPLEDRNHELWFSITTWAFSHSDIELLEEAYEVFLTQPTDFADQYPFLRVKLMHRLLTGKLTEEEVADFLGRLLVLPEALEFERYIWPRVEQAGLASARLEGLLRSTVEQLRHTEPRTPVVQRSS